MPDYRSLSISNLEVFFGVSPKPVSLKNGLVIGGGTVYPEINLTLPSMGIPSPVIENNNA